MWIKRIDVHSTEFGYVVADATMAGARRLGGVPDKLSIYLQREGVVRETI